MFTLSVIIIFKPVIFYLIIFLNFIIEIIASLLFYNTYSKWYFFFKCSVKLCFLQRVKIYYIKIRN